MSKPSPYQRIVLFGVPFLLWLLLFRDFISGQIPFVGDTNANYLILKYFFNNILNGTFPLWDPYTYLGRHFIYVLSSCALNPFAWIIPLLTLGGLDFYQAYLCFIVPYYFLGCLGFWCLLKDLLKEERSAFLGFIMLLFSGMGAMLFNQILIVYIFVPTVWFFVFVVRFFRSFQTHDFLFGIFTLMVLCVSCFPFYFLTFFLVLNFFFVIIFPDVWLDCFHGLKDFIVRRWGVVSAGLLALLIAAGPVAVFKVMDAQGDAIYPGRHKCQTDDPEECSDDGMLRYNEVAYYGSLGERMPPGELIFRNLDKRDYNADDFFYIPFLCYFLILLACLTRFDRLRLLVLAVGASVFLIALGAAAPLHGFLYDRIFFFALFRNLYFFIAFLIPLIIFFGVAQYKAVMETQENTRKHTSAVILALSFIAMLAIFLHQGQVLTVSYISLAVSVIIGLMIIRGYFIRRPLYLLLVLVFVVLLEPWYVFTAFQHHVPSYQCALPKEWHKTEFSLTRPEKNTLEQCLPLYKTEFYSNLRYSASLKDNNGIFEHFPDTLMRQASLFAMRTPVWARSAYTHHKILVYDHVLPLGEKDELSYFIKSVGYLTNNAFVPEIDGPLQGLAGPSRHIFFKAFVADGKSAALDVVRFSANQLVLKTSFGQNKFLVYNDAYSSNWKVYVDGRQVRLYMANIAFKGVFIPKGEHTVDFRYEPPGEGWIYWLLMLAMMVVPISGFWVFSRNKAGFPHEA